MKKVISKVMIALIYVYKYTLSPFLQPACRYTPTCSAYGIEALRRHGPFRGGYLTIKRFISCNPWGGHGHDPVPGSIQP